MMKMEMKMEMEMEMRMRRRWRRHVHYSSYLFLYKCFHIVQASSNTQICLTFSSPPLSPLLFQYSNKNVSSSLCSTPSKSKSSTLSWNLPARTRHQNKQLLHHLPPSSMMVCSQLQSLRSLMALICSSLFEDCKFLLIQRVLRLGVTLEISSCSCCDFRSDCSVWILKLRTLLVRMSSSFSSFNMWTSAEHKVSTSEHIPIARCLPSSLSLS